MSVLWRHKHFTLVSGTKLFSGFSYYLHRTFQSLWHSLWKLQHNLVSSRNGPEHSPGAHLPALPQVILFTHSGSWRVLLTTCNQSPHPHPSVPSKHSYPLLGLRHIFSVDAIPDSKRWPHNILCWAPKHITWSIILIFFLGPFVSHPPVFGLFHLTTNSQLYKIPHNECHKTTNQKLN